MALARWAPAPHLELIQQSHERCRALGLSRGGRPDPTPLMRADLAVAREMNRALLAHATPVMDLLLEQVAGTQSLIVLTDAQGTVLHTAGDRSIVDRTARLGLLPGASWAEHAQGTNAVGTALFAERATLVHGPDHFMQANQGLTCSAVPIFDGRGNLRGVLDVTAGRRDYHPHTLGLARMAARMIENHWLDAHGSGLLRLHFHARAELVGSLLEGIVVVGLDGRLVGANRSALDQLGLSSVALRNQTLPMLFGITLEEALEQGRRQAVSPLTLRLPDERAFVARARLEGPGPGPAVPCAPRGSAGVVAPIPSGALADLQTGDAQIEAVVQKARRILDHDIALLIMGETGTGKEMLAHAVHRDSRRAAQPFVAVNCASIPDSLIEAELFGYDEGAFTGARRKGATGRIAQAHGGTLFLDEIGDMPLPLQARLLRVLQERRVTPLGSNRSIPVDIAVISATHRNLRELIEHRQFREDLYYRLNGLVLRLPALRERSDLPVLAQRILASEAPPQGAPRIGAEVMALLQRCDWPGNVRQLANLLRTAVAMAAGEPQINVMHLPDDFLEELRVRPTPLPSRAVQPPLVANTTGMVRQHKLSLIHAALEAAGGNVAEAAKQLGISRNTIYRRLGGDASARQQLSASRRRWPPFGRTP